MKGLVIGILILMLGVNIGSTFAGDADVKTMSSVSFDGNTLYVGGSGEGNYTTIQGAINDAVDGDTVFVYDDSAPYIENIIIDKALNLIGEDRDTTIIDGNNLRYCLSIESDWVKIEKFTIKNPEDFNFGIISSNKKHIEILNNIFLNNYGGIKLNHCSDVSIFNNKILNSDWNGIVLENFCKRCKIENNTIKNLPVGILINNFCSIISIQKNILYDNSRIDICISLSNSITIIGNTISNSTGAYGGLDIESSSFLMISKNNFMNNKDDVYIEAIGIIQFLLLNRRIIFSNNYWDEWDGSGPVKIDVSVFLGDEFFNIYFKWFPFFDWNPAQEPYDIGV